MNGNDVKTLLAKNLLAQDSDISEVNTINDFLVGKGLISYLPVAKKEWMIYLEKLAIVFHQTAQDIHAIHIKNNEKRHPKR